MEEKRSITLWRTITQKTWYCTDPISTWLFDTPISAGGEGQQDCAIPLTLFVTAQCTKNLERRIIMIIKDD